MRTFKWGAALLALALLSACGSSPVTRYYTLSPAGVWTSPQGKGSINVAIGGVSMPDGLDRPQIVLRGAGNQVTFSEFERWLGSPKDEIALAVAGGLKQALSDASVFASPMGAGANADFNVLLQVQRFDSVMGDSVGVDVLWQVVPAKGGAKAGQSTVREPAGGPGYEALVAAHGRALAAVGRDIAGAIRAR
jgi:uncharacterized lipoprotein YmbA